MLALFLHSCGQVLPSTCSALVVFSGPANNVFAINKSSFGSTGQVHPHQYSSCLPACRPFIAASPRLSVMVHEMQLPASLTPLPLFPLNLLSPSPFASHTLPGPPLLSLALYSFDCLHYPKLASLLISHQQEQGETKEQLAKGV